MSKFIDDIVKCWTLYGESYIDGAGRTIVISLVGTIIGCIIGFAVGIVQTIPVSKNDSLAKKVVVKILKIIMRMYVELFRGTPMIVQAVFLFYGVQMIWDVTLGMWPAAFLVVSVNTGAYMAETVRGGINSIDPGQTEGAKAIGMTHVQTMLSVILPQAFRNLIPQIGNNLIINIKDTSVLSIISVTDLFFVHKSVAGALYKYFASATITMLIYLTLTVTASLLLRMLEKKLDGDSSFDLATTDTLAHTSGMLTYHEKKKDK